jgi:hypothetical protein
MQRLHPPRGLGLPVLDALRLIEHDDVGAQCLVDVLSVVEHLLVVHDVEERRLAVGEEPCRPRAEHRARRPVGEACKLGLQRRRAHHQYPGDVLEAGRAARRRRSPVWSFRAPSRRQGACAPRRRDAACPRAGKARADGEAGRTRTSARKAARASLRERSRRRRSSQGAKCRDTRMRRRTAAGAKCQADISVSILLASAASVPSVVRNDASQLRAAASCRPDAGRTTRGAAVSRRSRNT